MSADPGFPLKFTHEVTELYLHENVLLAFKKAIQKQGDNENFGIIIGSKSDGKETYWIEKITTPFPKDSSSFSSFVLKDPNHQLVVDHAFEYSNGRLGYLGTWHTHPESHPSPSEIDETDWVQCVSKNKDRQLFFFIIGRKEISAFKHAERKFLRMKIDKTVEDYI